MTDGKMTSGKIQNWRSKASKQSAQLAAYCETGSLSGNHQLKRSGVLYNHCRRNAKS